MIPQLPNEVVDQMTTSLLDFRLEDPIQTPISPSDERTKTLLSLARTSRATSPLALHYLYTYCVYINSLEKIQLLSRTLSSPSSCHYAQHISSLSLALHWKAPPFTPGDHPALIALLNIVSPTLQRLLLDVPASILILTRHFDPVPPEKLPSLTELEDADSRLITVFDSFARLEISCYPEGAQQEYQPLDYIWTFYPNPRLRGLPDLPENESHSSWRDLLCMPKLETFVVLRDGLTVGGGLEEGGAREVLRKMKVLLVHDVCSVEDDRS